MDGQGAPRQVESLTNQGVRVSRCLLSRRRNTTARCETGGGDEALGERGRRVFEDAGAKERRRDPNGSERRNFLEDDCGLRRAEKRRRISLLVLAGGDQGDGTLVIRRTGVGMEARVQLRRSRETQREDQGREQTTRDDGMESFVATHFDRDSAITSIFPQGISCFRSKGRRS